MTTAELRKQAQAAADRCEWSQAAELWEQAIEAYPPHHPDNRLAAADLDMMRGFAKRCRNMAADERVGR